MSQPLNPQTPVSLTSTPYTRAALQRNTYISIGTYLDFAEVRDTVLLGRDPVIGLEAATKQYVDNIVFPLPPLVGCNMMSTGGTTYAVYGMSVQQSGITSVISTNGIPARPVVTLATPSVGNGYTETGLGYGISFVSAIGSASYVAAVFAVFRPMDRSALVFVNPWCNDIQSNPPGAGVPVGQHSADDRQKMIINLPATTPAVSILSLIGLSAPITPSAATGLVPGTMYDLTLNFMGENDELINTNTFQVDGTNAGTFATLITAINNSFTMGTYTGTFAAPRCAWNFDDTIVVACANDGLQTRWVEVITASSLLATISNYYYGAGWSYRRVPASGQTTGDPYAGNTDSDAAGLAWVVPVVQSPTSLSVYQPG